MCNEAGERNAFGTVRGIEMATGSAAAHKPSLRPARMIERCYRPGYLLAAKAPATYQVRFTTTKGNFVISVTCVGFARRGLVLQSRGTLIFMTIRVSSRASGFVVQWGTQKLILLSLRARNTLLPRMIRLCRAIGAGT